VQKKYSLSKIKRVNLKSESKPSDTAVESLDRDESIKITDIDAILKGSDSLFKSSSPLPSPSTITTTTPPFDFAPLVDTLGNAPHSQTLLSHIAQEDLILSDDIPESLDSFLFKEEACIFENDLACLDKPPKILSSVATSPNIRSQLTETPLDRVVKGVNNNKEKQALPREDYQVAQLHVINRRQL
jgi:hypothetical protein